MRTLHRLKTLCLIASIALLSTSSAAAQADGITPIGPTPYNLVYFQEVIEANTVRASSLDSLEQIPKSELYRVVFRKILGDTDLLNSLSFSDRELILSLPSHRVTSFAVPQRIAQVSLCQRFDLERSNQQVNIVALAKLYEANRKADERELEQHYEDFLESLGESGRWAIENEIAQLSGTMRLTYATLNIEGMSWSLPDKAYDFFENHCTYVTNLVDEEIPIDELLSNEPFVSIPFG